MRPLLLALALGLMAPAIPAAAADESAPAPSNQCFSSRNWAGWSAPGDGDTLLLRVNINDVYRVELTPGSHVRKVPDRFIVNELHGSGWICSPLDLQMTLQDRLGFRQALIARDIHKLTPEEIAAIPREDLPS